MKTITLMFYSASALQIGAAYATSFYGFHDIANLCFAFAVGGIALGNWTRIREIERRLE